MIFSLNKKKRIIYFIYYFFRHQNDVLHYTYTTRISRAYQYSTYSTYSMNSTYSTYTHTLNTVAQARKIFIVIHNYPGMKKQVNIKLLFIFKTFLSFYYFACNNCLPFSLAFFHDFMISIFYHFPCYLPVTYPQSIRAIRPTPSRHLYK